MPTVFVPAGDAADTVMRLAQPQLRVSGDAVAAAIVANVPVHHGVMRASYHPEISDSDDGLSMHVVTGSPFWHWLEFGTATSPAYRPVETGVRSLGLRYEAL